MLQDDLEDEVVIVVTRGKDAGEWGIFLFIFPNVKPILKISEGQQQKRKEKKKDNRTNSHMEHFLALLICISFPSKINAPAQGRI